MNTILDPESSWGHTFGINEKFPLLRDLSEGVCIGAALEMFKQMTVPYAGAAITGMVLWSSFRDFQLQTLEKKDLALSIHLIFQTTLIAYIENTMSNLVSPPLNVALGAIVGAGASLCAGCITRFCED